MAKRSTTRSKSTDSGVETSDYRHADTRKNIPPARIERQGSVPKAERAKYHYNQHLPPELRFDPDGKADRIPELIAAAQTRPLTESEAATLAEALRNQQPWLEWAGKKEQHDRALLRVNPVALHLHECVSAKHDGAALPFTRVQVSDGEKFKTCVPMVPLRIAAGDFGDSQDSMLWDSSDWVTLKDEQNLKDGMFVAQVFGRSMEPLIPSGSYCLFRKPKAGTRQGRVVVVQHHGISDPETGGRYTIKTYESRKIHDENTGEWRHDVIRLLPKNQEFPPIELTVRNEGEVSIVAEFVQVL